MTDDDFDDPPTRDFSHNLAATTTTGLRQLRRTATPNLGECGEVTSDEWTRSVGLFCQQFAQIPPVLVAHGPRQSKQASSRG